MAYDWRYLNRPELNGSLIKQYNSCGKKNCHCARDGKGHEANYLVYRVYTPNPEAGTKSGFVCKLKKMYIPQADVKKWQRKIALAKAPYIYDKLPLKVFDSDPIFKIKQMNKRLQAIYTKYRVNRTKDAKQYLTSEEKAQIKKHKKEAKNYYLRSKHELSLIKQQVKDFNHLLHPYNSKARSIAGTKGWIKRKQKYYANKHFSFA